MLILNRPSYSFIGDKIIEINGTSVHAMTHEKALNLLRDSESEKLHLKLLKCGGNPGN